MPCKLFLWTVDDDNMAKLGSHKRPAVVRVKSKEHAHEILSVCHQNNWQVIVGIESDKPENIEDFNTLLNPQQPSVSAHVKIGRNDVCHCGSGKKFKKCCLSRGEQSQNNILPFVHKKSPDNLLVTTMTRELFQPMRLYYRVHNRKKLATQLKKLRCVDYYEESDEWAIFYTDEAANIQLGLPPEKVPPEAQPLIIARLHMPDEHSMVIDVRSIERASKILEFIYHQIPRKIAEVTHAAIYNQLITADSPEGAMLVDFTEIFDKQDITLIDPEKTIAEMEEIAALYEDKREALIVVTEKTLENSRKPLPKVEKFPVYLYDEVDELYHFETMCQIRQVIAMQHFNGNTDFTFYDIAQKMFPETQLLPALKNELNMTSV